MKRKMIVWAILFAIAIAMLITCTCFIIKLHYEEMAEQIEKFGFYKDGLKVNIERTRQLVLLVVGEILCFVCLLATAVGLSFYVDKLSKEQQQ